jgi:hypothetical protein
VVVAARVTGNAQRRLGEGRILRRPQRRAHNSDGRRTGEIV